MAERTSQHPKSTRGTSAKANAELASVMERNIASLIERRRREEARIGRQARIADAATKFTGNIAFVYFCNNKCWFCS
jgi:N-acyl-D-aspartate/D-glutamate deacylase